MYFMYFMYYKEEMLLTKIKILKVKKEVNNKPQEKEVPKLSFK